MPQMAPLWWEMLYMLFITMMIMTNILLYWNKNKNLNNKNYMMNNPKYMNWKW
uniref:ATPase subunit 8 n=1 Tax=Parathyginus sp. TaxID=2931301 RepID=A0A8T9ZXU4_9HEMI|nr:ATPase subunit 8 [Parathyginus sp.]